MEVEVISYLLLEAILGTLNKYSPPTISVLRLFFYQLAINFTVGKPTHLTKLNCQA